MLALVIFINRSGTMVIPFLSVYLSTNLGLSLVQTGWIMGMFGLGAIAGAFLGGYLTDRVGHFWVQFISLMLGGLMFLALSQITSFYPLAAFIFLVSLVTEMLRPANQTSVAYYAKPENVTRAFSLNRMAINLGFSVGPAIGGLLAATSYQWLFVADAITCMTAGLVFFFYFRKKSGHAHTPSSETTAPARVWQDRPFLAFIFFVVCFATLFFQLFTTWPLYYRQGFQLLESEIGLLLGLNGFMVFLFEMILVYAIGERISLRKLIVCGTLFNAAAFGILWAWADKPALYLAVLVISTAEILAMPFMATYTIRRSGPRNRGAYMGLYSMAFASAFVLAPLIGTQVVDRVGFAWWWGAAGLFGVVAAAGFAWVLRHTGEAPKPDPVSPVSV